LHAALLKSAGQDVVKKSSTRKNRYLMVFNCQIAPIAGGKLVRSPPFTMMLPTSSHTTAGKPFLHRGSLPHA
jgi:hypothetical protein